MAASFDVVDWIEDEIMYLDYLNRYWHQFGVIEERGDLLEEYRTRKFKERFCLSKEIACYRDI